jgi:hypothetical protein
MNGIGLTLSLAWPSVVLHVNIIWVLAGVAFEFILTALRGRTHGGGR